MARLPTSLLRRASAIDAYLSPLLGPCRDLRTAQNELRWLREHVDAVAAARRTKGHILAKGALLRDLVRQRARGKPLQYILGTEYFGELEIACRPGVLIPRQDTAASVSHLVRLVRDAKNLPPELRILDLCTGTGCIPLLFRHDFYATRDDIDLRILGVDVSNDALKLALANFKRVYKNTDTTLASKGRVDFLRADVLANCPADPTQPPSPLQAALGLKKQSPLWDILISNPPYISPSAYWKTTTRSVRGFEPALALVPPEATGHDDIERGDAFYRPILSIARDVQAKIVLLEIADVDQALRVARMVQETNTFDGIEIWNDQPDAEHTPTSSHGFPIIGQGSPRSVICWRDAGSFWLGKIAPDRHAR